MSFSKFLRSTKLFKNRPRKAGKIGLFVESLEARDLFSVNPIVAENQLQGTPQSAWDLTTPAGDPTIQGFGTDISVNHGQTINFKISDTANAPYHLDIYRMGTTRAMGRDWSLPFPVHKRFGSISLRLLPTRQPTSGMPATGR